MLAGKDANIAIELHYEEQERWFFLGIRNPPFRMI
jgi:hypothetical protein